MRIPSALTPLVVMVVLLCGLVLMVLLMTVLSLITVLRSMVVLFSCRAVPKVTVAILKYLMLNLRITSLVLMVVLLIGIKAPVTVFWKMLHLRTTSQTDPVVQYSGSVLMVPLIMLPLRTIGL